jgi:hypothetical protein
LGQGRTVRCEQDGWDFDPRYTEGRCPICGSRFEIADAAPRWLLLSRRVPWDIVLLFALFFVLACVAQIVIQAAGLWPSVHLHVPSGVRHLLHLR